MGVSWPVHGVDRFGEMATLWTTDRPPRLPSLEPPAIGVRMSPWSIAGTSARLGQPRARIFGRGDGPLLSAASVAKICAIG